MKRKLALLNSTSVILVVLINYSSQVIRYNNTTIGEMSARYQNLFTPAGYAFSIWGLIFLSLAAYSIFQLKRAFPITKTDDCIIRTGYWFIITNILNCLWLFAFVYDFYRSIGSNYVWNIIFFNKNHFKNQYGRWDAPLKTIVFVWWPICLYAGWISVASIANVATYLIKLNWDGGYLSPETWTIIMILIAAILNLLMVLKRNMREFAMVGVWALVAIFIRHQDSNIKLAYVTLVSAIIVFSISAWHGYQNRATNPFQKLINRK